MRMKNLSFDIQLTHRFISLLKPPSLYERVKIFLTDLTILHIWFYLNDAAVPRETNKCNDSHDICTPYPLRSAPPTQYTCTNTKLCYLAVYTTEVG